MQAQNLMKLCIFFAFQISIYTKYINICDKTGAATYREHGGPADRVMCNESSPGRVGRVATATGQTWANATHLCQASKSPGVFYGSATSMWCTLD